MKKIGLLLAFFLVGTAHAAQFIRVTKSDAVIGYKEPTVQSKMLNVFKEGDVVEVVAEKDGWYKVKIPFNQGYFLYGWVLKNTPFLTSSNGSTSQQVVPLANAEAKPSKRPKDTGLTRNSVYGDEKEDEIKHSVRTFGGYVYNVHKFGANQYKAGLSYEIPLAQNFKLGVPVSYSTGGGFHALMFGLEAMYSFYIDAIAISPRVAFGLEYLYGNSKSFQAIDGEFGPMIEYAISRHITLGLEPFTLQAMGWNSTDSINKVPFNVRAQSMILIRGRW